VPVHYIPTRSAPGAISDSSTSKYRRRYWIVLSTVVLVVSTLVLAYCQGIAAVFVDLFRGGVGDWDPERNTQASHMHYAFVIDAELSCQVLHTAIALAIISFYLLDFALNALQASLRNLLLDVTPSDQLNAGNAWHGRMTHAGNIVGFGFGTIHLQHLECCVLI
jgi:solute carrier family 45, member 1/2/4